MVPAFWSEAVKKPRYGPKAYAQRFWSKVAIRGEDECWLWRASVLKSDGYGQFGSGKRAHRVAFELSGGTYENGPLVLHTCDVRLCCNPAHLYAGTHARNMVDAVERGRFKGGQKGRTCKLSKRQRAILRAHKGAAPVKALAVLFNISEPHTYAVLGRRYSES